MKHPFTRTKSVFLLSSLHTLDYHLPRTNCLQGGKSNTRWLCYPLANNSIWCCCICLNVPSSGISFCTNFKFFYSVLYPVGPLDWYFKLLCCKLRNMVKYILLCYCWCLTFCLCYFFTFFFKLWSTASVPNANSYSSCSFWLFWCQAYSYIPYEGQVEAVPIYSLYFPIPAACGTFMGILGLCGDL